MYSFFLHLKKLRQIVSLSTLVCLLHLFGAKKEVRYCERIFLGRNPFQPTVPQPPSQKAQKIPTFASAVSVQTLWRSDQQLHQILLLLLRTSLLESAHENTADGYCCRRTLIHSCSDCQSWNTIEVKNDTFDSGTSTEVLFN